MPNIQVSAQGIEKLLKGLNPHKAAGPDKLKPIVLQTLHKELAPILQLIYQRSLDTGKLFSIWKEANVSPIFKKGEKSDLANYRPTSLTCVLCKVLEHVVASTISKHFTEQNILFELQHGFREKISCETQLIMLVDELKTCNLENKLTLSSLILVKLLIKKKVREKSRECHNHKPQPFPDPKRKRKPTNLNKHKPNKRTKSTKISSLFPKRGNRNTKRTEKHKNKMTHGKTYNKSPRRINHKATKSKTNTGTTALKRPTEQTTGGFKALLQLANFTLGPDATLNTEIHKNSVRKKAPNSVNASKRKHKNQINHYNKQRQVFMANSTVC